MVKSDEELTSIIEENKTQSFFLHVKESSNDTEHSTLRTLKIRNMQRNKSTNVFILAAEIN